VDFVSKVGCAAPGIGWAVALLSGMGTTGDIWRGESAGRSVWNLAAIDMLPETFVKLGHPSLRQEGRRVCWKPPAWIGVVPSEKRGAVDLRPASPPLFILDEATASVCKFTRGASCALPVRVGDKRPDTRFQRIATGVSSTVALSLPAFSPSQISDGSRGSLCAAAQPLFLRSDDKGGRSRLSL